MLRPVLRSVLLGMCLSLSLPVQAQQVLPDSTLNTQVTRSLNDFTITGGSTSGTNLFHSFQEFSIPTGGSAIFNNATNIQNIFSRVTGGTVSNIDGLLKANGTANLFLLNPNGILLGGNAFLNIGGSFIATTASSIKFADGLELTANASTPPLLTMSVPIGLQFGSTASSIQVQGQGNDGIVPTAKLGIVAQPGRTIALVGGDVSFSGGVVTAPVGRIEVGAVGSGTVNLIQTPIGWQLGYDQVKDFRDIDLTARSSLWNPYLVSNPFGGIQVVGRDIRLDQSQIAAAIAGSGQGGNITINAARTLALGGVNAAAQAPSAWIVNQVGLGATGNGGSINIRSGQLTLQDGAAIETLSLGSGAAGQVNVTADTIEARGATAIQSPLAPLGSSNSRIASSAYAAGASGDISVSARNLTLADSGSVSTIVFPRATGQGGTISVDVGDTLNANGISPLSFLNSGINSYTFGTSNSGNVRVSTGTLNLTNGGGIFTFASRIAGVPGTGIGNAGDVTVAARQSITMSGASPVSPAQISFLGSSTTGSGNSGNISVATPYLSLLDGAVLSTGSVPVVGLFGDASQSNNLGDSGNVTVNVSGRLTVSGINPFTLASTFLGSSTYGSGNAGDVTVQANQLQVLDDGAIANATGGSGNAGNLTLQANDIIVSGKMIHTAAIGVSATLVPETARQFYNVPAEPSGNIGVLNITTNQLTVTKGGRVTVTHEGTGNAGQLNIQANQISLQTGNILATTASGEGGDINIKVRDTLVARYGSRINAEAGSNGNGGNITIAAPIIVGSGNSDIIANAFNGNGGNINITTQGIFGLQFRKQLTPENDITASSKLGVNGTVEINNFGVDPNSGLVELPATIIDPSQKIAKGCDASSGSQFVITGRGGVPKNPSQEVIYDHSWNDMRDLSTFHKPTIAQTPTPTPTIVQATSWQRNPQTGKVELLATQPARTIPSATCARTSPSTESNL
jgi:filamentous hemagglutinin family protein